MKRDKAIFLYIIGCVLMFNILLHTCHESHDETEEETTSHQIEHNSKNQECSNEFNCTTCTTKNSDLLEGIFSKSKQLIKRSISSLIFLDKIKNHDRKTIFLFKKLSKTIDIIHSVKHITTVILRQ